MMDSLSQDQLGEPVPMFPLPNCVLLPGGVLPLHVFEPRYRHMTRDLLDLPPARRLLAIALLSDNYEQLYHTNRAPIHPVVGVGQLIQHAEVDDGCYNILVVGRGRARVTLEDATGDYRRAMLRLLPTEPSDMLASVHDSVDDVRALMNEVAHQRIVEPDLVRKILEHAPTAAAMVDIGAFHLVDNDEMLIKQRILEEEQLETRAEILALELRRMLEARRAMERGGDATGWPPTGDLN